MKRRTSRQKAMEHWLEIFAKLESENPQNALHFRTLTYEACLAEVSRGGLLLGLVPESYRTEEMFMAAVRNEPSAIIFIEKPSDEVQSASLHKNPFMIRFIERPTKSMKLLAKLLEETYNVHA